MIFESDMFPGDGPFAIKTAGSGGIQTTGSDGHIIMEEWASDINMMMMMDDMAFCLHSRQKGKGDD
jgi:hypothetical protein